MNVEFEVFVHAMTNSWEFGKLCVWSQDMSSIDGYALISTHVITLDLPEYDLNRMAVAELEERLLKEQTNHEVKVTDIKDRIQSLLALPAPSLQCH